MPEKQMRLPGRIIHWLFEAGIWLKGLDGLLEIVGGTLLLALSPKRLGHWMSLLRQWEAAEDPMNLLGDPLARVSRNLSNGAQAAVAVYLGIHGIVKVGLVAGLLMGKKSVYPWAMAFLGIFFLYQFYQYLRVHSTGLLAMTVIDGMVLLLVGLEYKRIQRLSR
jgi:uncharacterized membrane protein